MSVSRTIGAPAPALFALLADPATHPRIDGSGMLVAPRDATALTAVGDVFTMAMHNEEMGDYEIVNRVVVFEPDRRLSWEPVLSRTTRPDRQADVGVSAHHVWGWELAAVAPGVTEVTEYFDCTRSPQWLVSASRGGERWLPAITASLARLDALATGSP